MTLSVRRGILNGTLYMLGSYLGILLVTTLSALLNAAMVPYFFLPLTVYAFYLGYKKSEAPFTLKALKGATYIILITQLLVIYLNYVFFFFVYLNFKGIEVDYWNLLTYRVPSYLEHEPEILIDFIGVLIVSVVLYVVSSTTLSSSWKKQIQGE